MHFKESNGPWGVDSNDFAIKQCIMIYSRVASSTSQSIHSSSSILLIFPTTDLVGIICQLAILHSSILNFSLISSIQSFFPLFVLGWFFLKSSTHLGYLVIWLCGEFTRNWGTKLMNLLSWLRVVAIGGSFSPIPSQMIFFFFSNLVFVHSYWVLQ